MKTISIILTGILSINFLFAAQKEGFKKHITKRYNNTTEPYLAEETDIKSNKKTKFPDSDLFFQKRRRNQF